MTHVCKISPKFFDDIIHFNKRFEVRKDDRDPKYKIGDDIILKEYDSVSEVYTGRELYAVITYVLRDNDYCKDGYVIFGFDMISTIGM